MLTHRGQLRKDPHGECTSAPTQKLLRGLGGKSVAVTYEVSEFWGKRFGSWHGKLTGTAAAPK